MGVGRMGGLKGHLVTAIAGRSLVDGRIVEHSELENYVAQLRSKHGEDCQILVQDLPPSAAGGPEASEPRASEATGQAPQAPSTTCEAADLGNHILLSSFDRAIKLQAFVLDRAGQFTKTLLENNQRLADQANELQERFQRAMDSINLFETEKKLLEHDAMARRLARHFQHMLQQDHEAGRLGPASGPAGERAFEGEPFDLSSLVEGVLDGVTMFLGNRAARGTRN